MKSIKLMLAGASLLLCCGCGMQVKESTTVTEKASNENAVIENMMSRRSIRKYKPQAVNRDTMQIILNCGINAPNGQNKQSWAIRVVDNPDFINGITEVYKKQNPTDEEDLTFKTAFLIGCFQVLSVVPGTSRSGSTIIGGILVGTSRTVAAEFTFFLGIPVMFGASLLKLLKFGFGFTGTEVLILVIGMVVAFVVSILAIKFLMGYIKKHDFKAFGWYRIVLGALVLVYFIGKTLLA